MKLLFLHNFIKINFHYLLFSILLLSFHNSTYVFGQIVIKEKIVLNNSVTSSYVYNLPAERLLKTGDLFPGIIPEFTGRLALQFAWARQTYGTLSPESKVIIETKDTLIEHHIYPEFDYVTGADNVGFCNYCVENPCFF